MKEKVIKFFIDKAKRNKLIQSIFEQPLDLSQFTVGDTFFDSQEIKHNLYNGYRDKIKPGWEKFFSQDEKVLDKSAQRVEKIVQNGRIAVNRLMPVIDIYSSGVKNSRILEIGCSSGGVTYAFAEKNPIHIVGTEFSGYKIESINNIKKIEEVDLIEVNENLKELRDLVKDGFNLNGSNVSFKDDDICNSKLEHNSFDLICSWDVLEHIHNPLAAFKNIYNLLTDNGIAIHEYNPFFSLSGGHSACTIDFPWGHVMLESNDFLRFNEEKQPNRLKTAMSFYMNGLNRMTINDLEEYCNEANLHIESLIKFPKEQHLRMVDKKILELSKNNYPTIELDDLVTPKIIVIMKKSTK